MTSSSLVTLLVLAATAAVSPFSLVVFSLVLATNRGPRNGVAFIFGWLVTVMLIGAVMVTVGDAVDVPKSPTARKWFLALQLALGTVLILVWLRRRFRPRPHEAKPEKPAGEQPGWQKRIATMGYVGAFVLGGATQTWPVMIAAGAELGKLDISFAVAMAWMAVFALATIVGIVVLEVLAIRSPGTAAARLDRIRAYVANHRDSVINWLALLGGLLLVYRGLIGLIDAPDVVGVVQHRLIRTIDDLVDPLASARMTPMAVGRGAVGGEWARLELDGALVEVGGYDVPVVSNGETPHGRVTVLTVLGPGVGRLNGAAVAAGQLSCAGGGTEIHAAAATPLPVGVLSFAADDVARRARALGVDADIPGPGDLRSVAAPDWSSMRRELLTVMHIARRTAGGDVDPSSLRPTCDGLLDLVIHAFDVRRDVQPQGERQFNSVRITRECAAHAALTRYQDVSMATLCAVSGVSERRVRHAFGECYGMAPSAYPRVAALHAVRRSLIGGPRRRDAVSRAATDFGFGHLSRFAGHYRELFGESPSATLASRLAS